MDLQAIAAKLTLTDLQELIVRFEINEAVSALIAAGDRVNEKTIRRTMASQMIMMRLRADSDIQREEQILIPLYVRGGWKKQALNSGKVIALTQLEVIQLLEDLDNQEKDDTELLKVEEHAEDRRVIKDVMETRKGVVAKLT